MSTTGPKTEFKYQSRSLVVPGFGEHVTPFSRLQAFYNCGCHSSMVPVADQQQTPQASHQRIAMEHDMSTSEWDAFWEEQCHEFLETFPAQDTDMTSQESFISVPSPDDACPGNVELRELGTQ